VIFALVTHDRGNLEESSLQGLTTARVLATELGEELHAVLIGEAADGLIGTVGEYGASKVHLICHDGLTDYSPKAWGVSLAQLVESTDAVAVIGTGTERGNEVMAHLGALTGLPMGANCVEIDSSGETWTITRTRWGGSLLEVTTLEAPVNLVTITEHAVEAKPTGGGSADTEVFTPELSDADLITTIVDRVTTAEGVTLATAPVVVSGGRGVGSAEGFAPLEELAGLLGGVVGCSRVVTNNGWRPHSDQVGQTGTVIAPDLYIACGISGAIQHWVGMMASKTILAINTDNESPMVAKADYAVVGDLHEIVPAIVAEVRRRQGG
jgi:electron transfer flavoprotein alpha subunit